MRAVPFIKDYDNFLRVAVGIINMEVGVFNCTPLIPLHRAVY